MRFLEPEIDGMSQGRSLRGRWWSGPLGPARGLGAVLTEPSSICSRSFVTSV